jgi:hypothetical protein
MYGARGAALEHASEGYQKQADRLVSNHVNIGFVRVI